MKTVFRILGIFAILTLFPFTACDTGSGDPHPGEAFFGTWFFDKNTHIPIFDHSRTLNITQNRFEIQDSDGGAAFLKFNIEKWDMIETKIGEPSYPTTYPDIRFADYPIGFTLTVRSGTVDNPPVGGWRYYDPVPNITIYLHKDGNNIIIWWRDQHGNPAEMPGTQVYTKL